MRIFLKAQVRTQKKKMMMISKLGSKINLFLRIPFPSTPLYRHRFPTILQQKQALHNLRNGYQNGFFFKNYISVLPLRCLSSNSSEEIIPERNGDDPLHCMLTFFFFHFLCFYLVCIFGVWCFVCVVLLSCSSLFSMLRWSLHVISM